MSVLPPNPEQSAALPALDALLLFQSAPNPFLVVLPDDPRFTIVAATDAYVRVTGIKREEMLGRGIFDVFPDNPNDPSADGVKNLHASFRRAIETRAQDRMPLQRYDVERPDAGSGFEERYWHPLNTPVLDASGQVIYLLHWVEDATERVRADQKAEASTSRLRHSEKRFLQLSETTVFGLIVANSKGGISYLNPAMQQLIGYGNEDVAAGLVRWDHLTPPEYAARDAEAWKEVEATGKCSPYEKVYIAKDGRHVPILISASILGDVGGIKEVAAVIVDLTERNQSSRDAFLVRFDDTIRPLTTVGDIVREAVRLLGQHLNVDGCTYWQFEADEVSFEVTQDYTAFGVPQMTGRRLTVPQLGVAAATSFAAKKPYVVDEAEADPRTAAHLPSCQQLGIKAQISVPLCKAGRISAAFAVYQQTARKWGTEEVDLVQTVANRCWDSIRRAQAEADLRQQWHTFDTALSHTPDFTYIFDRHGRFTYLNRALLSLFQLSLEQARGKDFFDFGYPPELAKLHFEQIQQIVETKQSVRAQTPFAGPAGESRDYEYIFVPVLRDDGEVEAIAGSTRDITDRNRAEQLSQEDRRRWRDLLLQIPASIAIFRGPEHHFEWVNTEYVRLVGRPSDASLLGKSVREALPELEAQGYVDVFDRVYQTGQAHQDHEAVASLGDTDDNLTTRYVNFVCLATRDAHGQIDGTFIHATDITDFVRARKHIEESEQQFRTLAETIPHLAWMANGTGHIFWYNRRWYDYTGTTFQEMEGWGWEKVHDPTVLPRVMKEWTGAIQSGNPFEMTFPLKGCNGTFRSFLTRVEPIKDNQGRVVRWFGTNTDVTEQRHTEDELRRMNRELEEFAYVASHDLQEPLRMVNIYSQLMLKRIGREDAKLNEYAAFVGQGVTRMQELIQDLLTFSRTVHRDNLPAGTADLSESLSRALSVLKTSIEESKASITASALPTVQGDTEQLVHVFQNLISNSIKYRDTSRSLEIAISARQDGPQWIISVRDNGIGFEQTYAKQIFGLFKRLHKDEYPGTGLGLAICDRMIERYGGHMWAESESGAGATFCFALPGAKVT